MATVATADTLRFRDQHGRPERAETWTRRAVGADQARYVAAQLSRPHEIRHSDLAPMNATTCCHRQRIHDVVGGSPEWRVVSNLAPAAKSRHILTCYRQAIGKAGFAYLLDFELVPRNGQPLYLVFGTTHRRCLEKMKDSLWEVDRAQGISFRDPRDEQADALFDLDAPQLGLLVRLPTTRLQGVGRVRVEDLRDFTLFETVYRPEHVITALKPLVEQGTVTVEGGGALRRASFVSLAATG